ncbi:MAG: hypothetical protein ABSB94_04280 [Syntrophorhabdales bacterium]|jgi:hypothetical protein
MKSVRRPQPGNPYQDLAQSGSREWPILGWWECRYYRGDAASEPIMGRLSGRPKAQALAAEVVAFYDDCLLYRESPTLPSSLYEIGLHHDPIDLKHARIELRLGTNRTAEALSHELLHLRLGMLGYPMGEEVWIPVELVPHADDLIDMHRIVGNLLQHDLIFDTFLDLGFEKSRFLAPSAPGPDYGAIALDCSRSPDYREELGFPWWCLEYFRHWLSARHGAGQQSQECADSALHRGSRIHPQMMEATVDMRRIVESGALKDAAGYSHWTNRILGLMRLPQYTRWVDIRPGDDSSGGKPWATVRTDKRGPFLTPTSTLRHTIGTPC